MKRSLDLLSNKGHQRNQARRCLRVWTRGIIATIVCCSLVGLFKWRAFQQMAKAQASAEAEYEPIRQLNLENARLKKQIVELQKAEMIPLKLAVHEPLLALLGKATESVNQQAQRVYLNEFGIERAPLSLDPQDTPLTTVVFEGHSADKKSVEQLADSMRSLGQFTRVELLTENTATDDSQPKFDFTIECTNANSED